VALAIDQADAVAHSGAQHAYQVLGLLGIQSVDGINAWRIEKSHGPKVFVADET
jgi:hypothetical protein